MDEWTNNLFLFCAPMCVRRSPRPQQSTGRLTQMHADPHINECTDALTHTLMHTRKCMAHISLHVRTHTRTDHTKHRHMRTHARKVLPRRTSATLSSLKPAKYSPSAAVLSKLPTQARKRHPLPGRGVGRPAMGRGLHAPCLWGAARDTE